MWLLRRCLLLRLWLLRGRSLSLRPRIAARSYREQRNRKRGRKGNKGSPTSVRHVNLYSPGSEPLSENLFVPARAATVSSLPYHPSLPVALGIHNQELLSSIIRSPAVGTREGARRVDLRCIPIEWDVAPSIPESLCGDSCCCDCLQSATSGRARGITIATATTTKRIKSVPKSVHDTRRPRPAQRR